MSRRIDWLGTQTHVYLLHDNIYFSMCWHMEIYLIYRYAFVMSVTHEYFRLSLVCALHYNGESSPKVTKTTTLVHHIWFYNGAVSLRAHGRHTWNVVRRHSHTQHTLPTSSSPPSNFFSIHPLRFVAWAVSQWQRISFALHSLLVFQLIAPKSILRRAFVWENHDPP